LLSGLDRDEKDQHKIGGVAHLLTEPASVVPAEAFSYSKIFTRITRARNMPVSPHASFVSKTRHGKQHFFYAHGNPYNW
jgi:hypothetical protein